MSDRAMSWMPPGALPPMIMRMDAGSVPIGFLVFKSEGNKTTIGAMGDLANNIIRPLVQKNVPGTVAISPFGPNMRSIIINVDPQKHLTYDLNPDDLVQALKKGNVVLPGGNIYYKDAMPTTNNNATVVDIERLGNIPIKLAQNVYLRDVATIQDATRREQRYCGGHRAPGGNIYYKDAIKPFSPEAEASEDLCPFTIRTQTLCLPYLKRNS
jgi:multidrug efflux pump subunit AcrB